MIRFALFFLAVGCSSCFLSKTYSGKTFSYTDSGVRKTVPVIVPKGYLRMETDRDSAGNEQQFYYYPNGSLLYFAAVADTATVYQPINYDVNIPRQLYGTIYFKGIDSGGRYWRETRFGAFKTGYRFVRKNRDGVFDSSLNYFSIRSVR